MENIQLEDGRTVELELSDKRLMKAIIRKSKTKTAAARLLGVSRNTFSNMEKGTCHPDTLKILREFGANNSALIQ